MDILIRITAISLLLTNVGCASNEAYYTMIPSPSDLCPREPCLTLSQFAANSSNYLSTNTTLFFLQGNHSLESNLLVENVNMMSVLSNSANTAAVICKHSLVVYNESATISNSTSFKFSNVRILHISGLTFIGCAVNKVEYVNEFKIKHSSFIGQQYFTGTALDLVESSASIIGSVLSFNSGDSGGNKFLFVHYISMNGDNNIDFVTRAGGAILSNHSNVSIIESMFEGNSAQVGGAIFSHSNSNITIINSTFVGNHAASVVAQTRYYAGGVLHADSGTAVTVHNSTFKHNTQRYGGVIATAYTANRVAITITNCEFINNSADYGGVLAIGTNYAVTITDSKFTKNSAHREGGILHLAAADNVRITIIASEFSTNSAQDGGIVSALGASNTIVITRSNFTNNHAYRTSGGIVSSIGCGSNDTITITNSHFSDNSAPVGGVLRMTSVNVIVSQSTFTNNTANYDGGILYYTSSVKARSVRSTVIDYLPYPFDKQHYTVIITDSKFTKNRAVNGGVLHSTDTLTHTEVKVTGSKFTSNRADSNGGIMHTFRGSVAINDSQFDRNTAGNAGGVIRSDQSDLNISKSTFTSNSIANNGGVLYVDQGSLTIVQTLFTNNTANIGGVFWVQQTTISGHDVTLSGNLASTDGGVFYTKQTTTSITGTNFIHNMADNNGGTMYTDRGTTSISNSKFDHNTAGNDGGIIRSYMTVINITESDFISNRAGNDGGVLCTDQSPLTVAHTSFTDNIADAGGVIWADQGTSTITETSFTNNTASAGGVMWVDQASIYVHAINMTGNHGNRSIVFLLASTTVWSEVVFSDNVGSLLAYGSVVTITDNSIIMNNMQPTHRTIIHNLKEGGAITAYQSDILFNGTCTLKNNYAEIGGALNAIESKVNVHGKMKVANNTATEIGGGIFLYHSELTCWKNSTLALEGNVAKEKGGGIMASSSSIKVKVSYAEDSVLHFVDNDARRGGGIYFEMNAKLYVLKRIKAIIAHHRIVTFTSNSADYGGAVYVSDDGMCIISINSTAKECSFQTLAMYGPMPVDFDSNDTRCQNIHFFNNTAKISGHSLFGGLLERCTVSTFAEANINNVGMDYAYSNSTMVTEGHEYFQMITNVQDSDISSGPVRVCFCREGQPDCSYQPDPIQNQKGQQGKVSLSLTVVDQINHPLNGTTIYSRLSSGNDVCQNHIQNMDGNCNELDFNVFSNNDREEFILSVGDGPCQNTPGSQGRVTLEFSCPLCLIGFELDETRGVCQCICDSQLFPYFTNCSGEILVRDKNVWVTNITTSRNSSVYQYLIHPYCPQGYCHPPSSRVEINLNVLDGADTQCVANRSGLLCGTCKPGFSLSLGSSRCIPCSSHWPAVLVSIIIAAFLAGIALVALLLILNLTVAVGTLNGIIFYANIVAANSSVFLPFPNQNFITVFVSWLNLDIGFDTCFFEGMDAYWKTLLQLAFPMYVILLVVVVIFISEYSRKFAHVVGKRNPVATLVTLILLSYAKFLHTIISSLSSAVLKYPESDGSWQMVWLPDATVGYLKGKHIALFIVAILILVAGVFFTVVLLFWQWLLRHQDKKIFWWVRYQKLCHFIEPYHAPYSFKHRYWTGLLLLVRVILYMVFALNVNGDPQVSLVAIIFAIGFLLLVKGILATNVYKKWPVDVLEVIMYFNTVGFAAFTWYCLDSVKNQTAVAYTSVMITFILLLIVITFHLYKYTSLWSAIKNTKTFKKVIAKLPHAKTTKTKNTVELVGYKERRQEPSSFVVDIPNSNIEQPEPDANLLHLPASSITGHSLQKQESEIDNHNIMIVDAAIEMPKLITNSLPNIE